MKDKRERSIKIKFTGIIIIAIYLIITFTFFMYFLARIIAFIPMLYHISHAIVIGIIMLFACYKGIEGKGETKFLISMLLVLSSFSLSFFATEGILKFSTLFSNRERSSMKCIPIVDIYTTKYNTLDALIKMPDYLGLPANYKITKEEKFFIDKHIDSCVCIELLFYESQLGFRYTELGNRKGTIKLCDEPKL